jgi:hypothetical protein
VSKDFLNQNIQNVLSARSKATGSNRSPDNINEIFDLIASLLSDKSNKNGADDIKHTVESKHIPDSVKKGIFDPSRLNGGNIDKINDDLQDFYPQMRDFYADDSNWKNGYGYIPVEWIKKTL